MPALGTPERPLRVAVVGCGPSGFYVAQGLVQAGLSVQVDMFDRLPTPYGLVRYGVAPDHQKVKAVTKVYAKVANDPAVRWFGSVQYGRDLTLGDLRAHYHAAAFTTGAQTDRRLGIPGEDLAGSHPATEFVAWYNGHPDYRHLSFDLSHERAVVIGVGNVAIDVARILSRTPEEMAKTDVADYALAALKASRVREVLLVGRRGPAQAAFTNAEIEEVGRLAGADAVTLPEETALDAESEKDLVTTPDRLTSSKVAVLAGYAQPKPSPKPRRLVIRFLRSPTEIVGDAKGKVAGIRLVKNVLQRAADGSLKAKATGSIEDVATGLVFRSVGYRGVPLAEIPFDEGSGTVPHAAGRVVDPATKAPVPGLYVAGWIKRGPTGVIGTNRPCALESVAGLVADAKAGSVWEPAHPDREAVSALLASRGVLPMTFADWTRLDELEVARGQPAGRPRVKFVSAEEMSGALGR